MTSPDGFSRCLLRLWAKSLADCTRDDGYFAGIRTEMFDETIAGVMRGNDDAGCARGRDPQHDTRIQTGAHLPAISGEQQMGEVVDSNNHRAGAEDRDVIVRGTED